MSSPYKPTGELNPYAPPAASAEGPRDPTDDDDEPILADRGTRLGASILDGLVLTAAMVPAMVAFAIDGVTKFKRAQSGGSAADFEGIPWSLSGFALLLVPLAVQIYQWYLTAKQGQTLGKKWLRIRIVKLDNSPVDFVSGVVLRGWVVGLGSHIPYIGPFVWLADVLMIFGNQRRCFHDQIAGTKVVLAAPRA